MRPMSGNFSVTLKRAQARGGAVIAFVAAAGLALAAAHAAETLPGPVPAEVLKVVDGDTIWVKARIWLGQDVETKVRISGIDTPESYRPQCDAEREKATAARLKLEETVASRRITLTNVKYDKFGERVSAEVWTDKGESVASIMVGSEHARPYDGTARQSWCGKSQAGR